MWHLIACKISVSLSFLNWIKNEMTFLYCISELLLSTKIDIFFLSKKGLKILIYGINTIIKCDTWQPVKFQLVSRSWTGSKMKWRFFYCITELMLSTKIDIFLIQERFKNIDILY